MTIYKWWPSKGVLALEGYASTIDPALTVPDTGDIEADLTTQLLTYIHLLRDTPASRPCAPDRNAASSAATPTPKRWSTSSGARACTG